MLYKRIYKFFYIKIYFINKSKYYLSEVLKKAYNRVFFYKV